MAEVKNAFIKSKMNKDLDARLIPQGEYRDAVNIQVSKSEGDDVGALENILGNSEVVNGDFANDSGVTDLECIGYFADESNNTVYLFFTNYTDLYNGNTQSYSASADNFIYSYNTLSNERVKLVEGAFLNFSTNRPIIGVNILEEFLFFTDNRNQPRKINVNLANPNNLITPTYYTTEDNISVAKYYPYQAVNVFKTSGYNTNTSGAEVATADVNGAVTNSKTIVVDNVVGTIDEGLGILLATGDKDIFAYVTNVNGNTITLNREVTLADDTALKFNGLETSMYDAFSVNLPDGSTSNPYAYSQDTFPGDPQFLEDKFVRFSYRFKFTDGEYSLIAPFTQPCFIPKQDGYFLEGDEKQTFFSTVVEFMENKVNKIDLQIPLPSKISELETNFHISEIDIIYKESDALAMQVVETIPYSSIEKQLTQGDIDDYPFYEYIYLSQKPYKTLPSDEITRVYDKVPVKALGQEIISNRVVYANFQNKHTAPLLLDYQVSASEKYETNNTQAFPALSRVEYPNHSLKENRNYQVGIVLADRYGRQSTTILSNNIDDRVGGFGADTVYLPYRTIDDSIDFAGDSLKVLFNQVISSTKNENTFTPGLYNNNISSGKAKALSITALGNSYQNDTYSTTNVIGSGSGLTVAITQTGGFINSATIVAPGDGYKIGDLVNVVASGGQTGLQGTLTITDITIPYNPTGWYSYKIVVKQVEQDYYNVYTGGAIKGSPYYSTTTNPTVPLSDPNATFITLLNDNINKVPRDLTEVGAQDKQFRSSVQLFGRVVNTDRAFSNIGNEQYFPGRKSFTVNQIEDLFDAFDVLQLKNNSGDIIPITSPKSPYYAFFRSESNPFIAEFVTSQTTADQFGIVNLEYQNNGNTDYLKFENLNVLETKPTVSRLDIYYETSTAGLVSDLNLAVGEETGGATGVFNFTYNHSEADAPETVIVNEFSFTDILDNIITPSSLPTILSVFDNSGINRNNQFELVQGSTSNTYDLKTKAGQYFYYGSNASTLESYTFTFSVTVSGTTTEIEATGALSNANPTITNDNSSTIVVQQGATDVLLNLQGKNGSNDGNPDSNIYTQDLTFSIDQDLSAGTGENCIVVDNNKVQNTDPNAAGNGVFTLQITDAGGATATKVFNVTFGQPTVGTRFSNFSELSFIDGDGAAVFFVDTTTGLDSTNIVPGGSGQANRQVGYSTPSGRVNSDTDLCNVGPNDAQYFIRMPENSGTGKLTQGTFYVIFDINNDFKETQTYPVSNVNWQIGIEYRSSDTAPWSAALDVNNTSLTIEEIKATWRRGSNDATAENYMYNFVNSYNGMRVENQYTISELTAFGGYVFAFSEPGEYRITCGNLASTFGAFGTQDSSNGQGLRCDLSQDNKSNSRLNIGDFNYPPSSIAPDFNTNPNVYRYQVASSISCYSTFSVTSTSYYAAEPFAKYITKLYTDVNLTQVATSVTGTQRFRRMKFINTSNYTIYNPEYTVNGAYVANFTDGVLNGIPFQCTSESIPQPQ
jgi:hypothetical protein